MRRFRQPLTWVALAALTAFGSIGGCRCQGSVDENTSIDARPLGEEDPEAPRPTVHFPSYCRMQDPALNKFIEAALETCATGDYDKFRLLFGTEFTPPAASDFERIWKGVQSVEIISVRAGPQEPPEYYVHAMVRLRKPDRRERDKRDAVVAVFKEGTEWRMAPPPKEIIHQIMIADSQPATQPDRKP